jgi:hypothetical protein
VRLNVPWWGSHDNQSRGRRSKASANTAIPPIRRGCVCTLSANPSIAPQCPALSSTALADSSPMRSRCCRRCSDTLAANSHRAPSLSHGGPFGSVDKPLRARMTQPLTQCFEY